MIEVAMATLFHHLHPHFSTTTTTTTNNNNGNYYLKHLLPRRYEVIRLKPKLTSISVCFAYGHEMGAQDLSLTQNSDSNKTVKKRVFLLDVNPLCYNGSTPSLRSFAHWISLFFSQVSLTDPVIAVLDGEGGSDHRRDLLPSYKAHRRKPSKDWATFQKLSTSFQGNSQRIILDVLRDCNVPVLKVEGHEADDVIATLAEQVLQQGSRLVIGSPDKDFKQLISEDVQIVMPMPDLGRWSFYTLKHYIAQYGCDPSSDLSLRCILGDEVDGVPGIQHVVPAFGRKTAIKLLKKHGTLENLLNAAAVRTVGKPYVQDALSKHGEYLRKNYQVLSLRRDVDIDLKEDWLSERDTSNDLAVLSNLVESLRQFRQGHSFSGQRHRVLVT